MSKHHNGPNDARGSHHPDQTTSKSKTQFWRWLILYAERKMHERRASKEKKQAGETAPDRAARKTARATIWIATFTFVLVGVGFLQWHEMHTSGRDFVATQRGYIAPDPSWSDNLGDGIHVSTTLTNTGHLPAVKIMVWVGGILTINDARTKSDDSPPDFSLPINAEPITRGATLFPGAQIHSPYRPKNGEGISPDDLSAITSGTKSYFYFGWVKYFDGFDNTPQRLTEFCYRVVGGGDPQHKVMFMPCPKYNCADESCDDYAASQERK